MGKTSKYLLVVFFLVFWLYPPLINAEVNADDYDAFWLWSGIKTQSVLDKANTIYILQGQIDNGYDGKAYLAQQGNGLIQVQPKQLWLVYRAHALSWDNDIYLHLLRQLEHWKLAGLDVVGIQIDFDVPTRKLNTYIDFLKTLRQHLPQHYQLSITGLLDWGAHAQPTELNKLADIVNEVVLQTYQGYKTINNYQNYLIKLKNLNIPFKVGLVQYGDWQEPNYLKDNPYFLGYVVFLQNK